MEIDNLPIHSCDLKLSKNILIHKQLKLLNLMKNIKVQIYVYVE